VGLGVELCLSRTVRDTARLLDAVRGPGIGDTVIAPAPRRPYSEEVGADPVGLRVGLLDVHPRGGFVHADCVSAVRAAASMLEGLGHRVEPAWPACLADTTLVEKFMALWATQMAMAARGVGETLGREVTADDFEPVNWVLVEQARRLTAVDYAVAQEAGWTFRRALQQWWTDGWDLLLSPTLAEPPPPQTEFDNDPEHPTAPMRRAGRFAAFTPPFNMSGQPAISLPLHRTADGLPVGIQLAAAYGREDVLIRIASQLESAHPWVFDHPPIP
jgi:amidase